MIVRPTDVQLSLWFARGGVLTRQSGACCANPTPQVMFDTDMGKIVLQCMNCGAFC